LEVNINIFAPYVKGLIIAIDGPAGSGKSTSAKLIAKKLGYVYIDTGAMYRAITILLLRTKQSMMNRGLLNWQGIVKLISSMQMVKSLCGLMIGMFQREIRSAEVNSQVSDVSKISEVRKLLVEKQREMGAKGSGVVMEVEILYGCFPNADVKIFLTASLDIRANRRTKDTSKKVLKYW